MMLPNAIYLLSDVLLKHHTDVLLDGITVEEIAKKPNRKSRWSAAMVSRWENT